MRRPTSAARRPATAGPVAAASVALVLASLLAPERGLAQDGTAFTVSGGAAPYDLSGTGTSWVAGAELSRSLAGGVLVAEAGARLFAYKSQGGATITHLFPEAGLRLQAPLDGIRPYAGAGAGGSLTVRGRRDAEPTLHAVLGVLMRPGPDWCLRPEMRVRSVDPWVGTLADFTLGVGYRF